MKKSIADSLNYLNYRDNLSRKRFYNREYFALFVKSFLVDNRLKFNFRFFIRFSLFSKKRIMCNKVKMRNRCLFTGRSRFVLRYFRLSRASFRDLSSIGFISGLKKNS